MSNAKCDHVIREEHTVHKDHEHKHGADCGHTAIVHKDSHGCEHVDFVHKDEQTGEAHLHHACENGEDHFHECSLEDNEDSISGLWSICRTFNTCEGHEDVPCGTAECTHEAVPHGDHYDHLVPAEDFVVDADTGNGIVVEGFDVHCPHDGDHCDVRGFVAKAPSAPAP